MFVLKFPNPHTLASTSYSEESPGAEWELMSEKAFENWKTEQLSEGWVAQKSPEELAADTRKIWPSSADFWASFTDAEKLAILASTIAEIVLLREELRLWTGEVWSDDTKVEAGLNGLVAAGILTTERKATILTP